MNQTAAATMAAVFAVLYAAHQVGDHWVQTSCQAAEKGKPGWSGRWACTKHVATLTATKLLLLVPVALLLDLQITALGAALGLAVDAGTHWWADRRSTLLWLAKVTDKTEFHSLGTPAHPAHPATADGGYAPTLGTGAYALDQSWHVLWLLVAAVITATV
ncbi:transcriptional regulator [Kitasatospora sp. NPDC059088]|uniref:transcriptional regulator n=1 Tax=Kitasatospora sp. NPDC059088 TaxID=3346722 RepID=UPI0036913879